MSNYRNNTNAALASKFAELFIGNIGGSFSAKRHCQLKVSNGIGSLQSWSQPIFFLIRLSQAFFPLPSPPPTKIPFERNLGYLHHCRVERPSSGTQPCRIHQSAPCSWTPRARDVLPSASAPQRAPEPRPAAERRVKDEGELRNPTKLNKINKF